MRDEINREVSKVIDHMTFARLALEVANQLSPYKSLYLRTLSLLCHFPEYHRNASATRSQNLQYGGNTISRSKHSNPLFHLTTKSRFHSEYTLSCAKSQPAKSPRTPRCPVRCHRLRGQSAVLSVEIHSLLRLLVIESFVQMV